MRFEDIAPCELGVVLWNMRSQRYAVLVARFGPPVCAINIQYLDGDADRIHGCRIEEFKMGILTKGTLLKECASKKRVVLTADSKGPDILVYDLESSKKEKRDS
ncbi:MAG: hypothetical protein Greene041679_218 [Parcubacteria group bacterium Greene0416_79]|nr:MAG: hypothetical protein Greene041679_218 [Parcubacteria group bacterium Greene0416_79]